LSSELDLLVARREPERDARVLVDLRDRLLEACERAARADLDLDAFRAARIATLFLVERTVGAGELVDRAVLRLREPVRLDHDLRAAGLPEWALRRFASRLRGRLAEAGGECCEHGQSRQQSSRSRNDSSSPPCVHVTP